eukprot:365890-Chlamydomonas_euryale.AAC.9
MNLIPFSTVSAVWPRLAVDFEQLNFQFLRSPVYKPVTLRIVRSPSDDILLSGPLTLLKGNQRGFALSMPKFLPGYSANETWGLDELIPVTYAPEGACVAPNGSTIPCVIGNISSPYFDPDLCGDICQPRMVNGMQHVYWGTITVTVGEKVVVDVLDTLRAFDYKYCMMRIEDVQNKFNTRAGGFTIGIDSTVIFPETGRLDVVWELCVMPNGGWQPGWVLPLQIYRNVSRLADG